MDAVDVIVTAPFDADVIWIPLPATKAEVPSASLVCEPLKPKLAVIIFPWMLFAWKLL